jgi:hypothetical protein
MMLVLGLPHIVFIMLRNVPSILSFFRTLIMKWCWMFFKVFFCIYWEDHLVFVLTSAWNETDLVMVFDLFVALLNSVCQYFGENLCICIE